MLNDKYHLHASRQQLSELLKKADSQQRVKPEMESFCDVYSEYYFKKSTLTICDDKGLEQFDLHDNYFTLSIKSKKITIGEDASILKELFPNSYVIRDYMGDNNGPNQYMTCVRVTFRYEQYLLFMVNKQGKIRNICIWEDDT